MGKRINIPVLGIKYGQWTIISTEIKNNGANNRSTYFKVKCECGKEGWRSSYALKTNKTKSCKSCSKSSNFKNTFAHSYFRRIRKRAEKIKVNFDLNEDYLYDLYQKQKSKCNLSGVPIKFTNSWKSQSDQTASLDRIDNTKGYIKGNVQWVHKQINFMKGIMSQNTFIEMCNKVTSKCG